MTMAVAVAVALPAATAFVIMIVVSATTATTFVVVTVTLAATFAFMIVVVMSTAATAAFTMFMTVTMATTATRTMFMVVIVMSAATAATFVTVAVAFAGTAARTTFVVMVVTMAVAAATAGAFTMFVVVTVAMTAATAAAAVTMTVAAAAALLDHDFVEFGFDFLDGKADHLEHLADVGGGKQGEALFRAAHAHAAADQRGGGLTHRVEVAGDRVDGLDARTDDPEAALFVDEHVVELERTMFLDLHFDAALGRFKGVAPFGAFAGGEDENAGAFEDRRRGTGVGRKQLGESRHDRFLKV